MPDTVTSDGGGDYRRTAWLFLRLFGIVYLIVFLSLAAQVPVLMGSDGLLPAREFLAEHAREGWSRLWRYPTVFWLGDGDLVLRGGALAGTAFAIGLVLGWRAKFCLAALSLLFLSYVTVGRDFFWFQWDNLLLESSALALLLPASAAQPPHGAVVFLFRWLVFRLLFESGLAKVQAGAESWFPLMAMASYYETAPLPSLGGWYAHQLPLWIHRWTAGLTLLGELVGPLLIWGPRAARRVAFVLVVGFQVAIEATANYGYFNILAAVLALFLLDGRDLAWLPARIAPRLPFDDGRGESSWQRVKRRLVASASAAIFLGTLIEMTVLLAAQGVVSSPGVTRVRELYLPFRLVSKYHLFAHIDPRRVEAEIEWTVDGQAWTAYEFHYKPGDVRRPPSIVAPHQPRVDFQLWFFTLGRDAGYHPYFNTLVRRLCARSPAVEPLFTRETRPPAPPLAIRLAYHRYRMTDLATRDRDGVYWRRELLEYHPLAYFCDAPEAPRF